LPKDFNLNNIEANKVFLRALGLDENLATNPDMMKAIARYYYYSAGSSTRVVVPN
jgi:glucose-6-phosphate isomerase